MNPHPFVANPTVLTPWSLTLLILVIAPMVLHRTGRRLCLLLRRTRNRHRVAVMRAHVGVLPPVNKAHSDSRLEHREDLLAGMKIVSRVGAPAPPQSAHPGHNRPPAAVATQPGPPGVPEQQRQEAR